MAASERADGQLPDTAGPAPDEAGLPPAEAGLPTDEARLPTDEASLPQDEARLPPALLVRLNDDPSLGFCVYALRPFARGERLFRERTALEATHDPDPRGVRNVYARYCRLSPARRHALHGAFPHLAWANGVDPLEAAAARRLVASLVLAPRPFVLDNQLSAADHVRMRPDAAACVSAGEGVVGGAAGVQASGTGPPPDDFPPPPALSVVKTTLAGLFKPVARRLRETTSSSSIRTLALDCGTGGDDGDGDGDGDGDQGGDDEKAASAAAAAAAAAATDRARRETTDWFNRYAFRLGPGSAFGQTGGHHQAAVYLLTDLINHRCAGFQNCRVAADIGAISVLAVRDIAPGEEITINYSKDVKDFQCKGECCVKK